jgi:hypothetical protein
MPNRNKHSTLLRTFVYYGLKKFYKFGSWKESHSLFVGAYFTMCHKGSVGAKVGRHFQVKRGQQLKVYLHEPGEEELVFARLGCCH